MTEGDELLANLVQLGRLLRRLGLDLPPERLALLVEALPLVDLSRRAEVKSAARAVLVSRREHLALFDLAFDLFFEAAKRQGQPALEMGRILRRQSTAAPQLLGLAGGERPPESGGGAEESLALHTSASARELLRRKDFVDLTPDEARAVAQLLRRSPLVLAPRPVRRRRPARRGAQLDLPRMLRRSFREGGEMPRLLRRERKEKPRPLVALCDISGSMEPYARLLLQFLYTLRQGGRGQGGERREVFVFGTRLTRLTRELAARDPDRALRDAAARVVDWAGGTQIGESLRHFNYEWGRRVLGQGAVVLVISDGWERGDPALLARELARLGRSCSRLIWLNPLLGIKGYEPLTRGMQAALPFLDDFLPVHNLASLEQLAGVLRCAT